MRAISIAFAAACALAIAAPSGAPPARADTLSLSVHDRLIYQAAFKAAEINHWNEAKKEAALAQDPLLAKVIDWLYLSRPSTDSGFDATADFIARNPDWPKLDALRARAEDDMPDDMPPTRVREWFERYPPVTATGKIRYAEALLATGAAQEGVALLRRAWIEGNLGEKQAEIFLKKHRADLRPEDNLARLDRLLWDHQINAAHAMLRRVDEGHAALGEARIRLQAMAGGVDYALRRVPSALKDDPGLLFDRLHWHRLKNHDADAQDILVHAPTNLVRPEQWWAERAIQVHRALVKGSITAALRLAEQNGQKTGTPSYADAEWLAGWIALRQMREPELAFDHFINMGDSVRYPVSRARAEYWQARALEAMNRRKEADETYLKAAHYGVTYYGQLAALRIDPGARPSLPPPPQPAVFQREAFDAKETVRIVRQLGMIGQNDVKEDFIRRLATLATTPEDAALVADLAIEQLRPDLAVRLARLTWHNEMPLMAHGYPVRPLPASLAPENALVLAVIRQESAFDERAVSRAGALGLMQLMPATARKIASALGLGYITSRLTTDPDYNVRVGSAYLAQMLGDFGGNYILALSAYNAGPSRVRQWIRDQGDPRDPKVDAIDWIETIPYDETRNYVQRVLESLQVYRVRVPNTRLGSLEKDIGAAATTTPADVQ